MAGERKETGERQAGRGRPWRIFYPLLQWTWGIVQNVLGAMICLFLLLRDPHRRRRRYHGAIVTEWGLRSSMGLGMFIFFGHWREPKAYRDAVLVHEYGHTVQSCLLGPLFLPVIGLPSVVWAFTPVFARWRRQGRYSYYDFYPEKWANHEGERVLGLPAPKR